MGNGINHADSVTADRFDKQDMILKTFPNLFAELFPVQNFISRFPNFIVHRASARFYFRHDIARVHDESRPVGEAFVIHPIVRRGNQDGIERRNCFTVPFHRFGAGPMRMLAAGSDDRDVRVEIKNFRAPGFQQIHQNVGG